MSRTSRPRLSRTYRNDLASIIKQLIQSVVVWEMVPALSEGSGLRKNRSNARQTVSERSITGDKLNATLPAIRETPWRICRNLASQGCGPKKSLSFCHAKVRGVYLHGASSTRRSFVALG
jgi:hypothetical protein